MNDFSDIIFPIALFIGIIIWGLWRNYKDDYKRRIAKNNCALMKSRLK
jgi:hypothetical protein